MLFSLLSFIAFSTINYVEASPLVCMEEADGNKATVCPLSYLEKYGYLNLESMEYTESQEQILSLAIVDFQTFFGLEKTGRLDDETLLWMNKPRCGVPDRESRSADVIRRKRYTHKKGGGRWDKNNLTYSITNYTMDLKKADVDHEIARAFQAWENELTNITFNHAKTSNVDIEIRFASGKHCRGSAFDGPGNVVAHASSPNSGGDAHFDEEETWTINSADGTNLFQIAVHEIGHTLGMGHSMDHNTAMNPIYNGYNSNFKLAKDDVVGIKKLYEDNINPSSSKPLNNQGEFSPKNSANLSKEFREIKKMLAEMRVLFNHKLDATKRDLSETKVKLGSFNADLRQTLQRLRDQINAESNNLKKELPAIQKHLAETKNELNNAKIAVRDLTIQLNVTQEELADVNFKFGALSVEMKANAKRLENLFKVTGENLNSEIADLSTKLNVESNKLTDINKMPSSCKDLQQIGHKKSGFFPVMGSKKVELVYCNFHSYGKELQKWIGYVDVKPTPVYFYVQRNTSFSKCAPIPFDIAPANVGNAMNLTSGKFTAPRSGIYFFSFTGIAVFQASSSTVHLEVVLYLDGKAVGSGMVVEAYTVVDQLSPLTLQSTLNLKKGSQVWLHTFSMSPGVSLADNGSHLTHFVGWMLDEDIFGSSEIQ